MRNFLAALAETGDVPVPSWETARSEAASDVDDLLRAADAVARSEAPGDAPGLDVDAARWAARTLFRACVCLADRTVDASAVTEALSDPGPRPDSAAICWSTDLFLRHLPELHGLARGLAPSDPLVAAIERLGAAWPLSSVGMRSAGELPAPPPAVAGHACLKQVYVDRVIRSGDESRVRIDWVAEGVRIALGAHAELAPALAGAAERMRGGSSDG